MALRECLETAQSLLTRTMVSGEIETCDLTASVAQDADQLTLVGDTWTQPADGVGVEVAGDGHLLPGSAGIFLSGGVKRYKFDCKHKSLD